MKKLNSSLTLGPGYQRKPPVTGRFKAKPVSVPQLTPAATILAYRERNHSQAIRKMLAVTSLEPTVSGKLLYALSQLGRPVASQGNFERLNLY